MTFLPCPHGFECSSFLDRLNINLTCNIQDGQIVIPESSWFGIINDSYQAFSFPCLPSYYCHNVFKVGVENSLCMDNRPIDKMCEKCIAGLSGI